MRTAYLVEMVIKFIESHKMNLNQFLIEACEAGDFDKVKKCISQGADIKAMSDNALRVAAENGHLVVVNFLIENGADVNAGAGYPLSRAAGNGHLDVAKLLIDNGADVHANNDYALGRAIVNGRMDAYCFLVSHGAVNDVIDWSLQVAAGNGDLEMAKLFVDLGANIRADNDLALQYAIKNGHSDMVQYLENRRN